MSNKSKAPNKQNRFRRWTSTLLALLTAASLTLAGSESANAASSDPQPWMEACFQTHVQHGAPKAVYQYEPVRVKYWNWRTGEQYFKTVHTGWTGCTHVSVPAGWYYRFEVNNNDRGYVYVGGTGWAYLRYGTSWADFGIVTLMLYRI